MNPVGRLTRVTTAAAGVVVTNYYSYCNCSSVDAEATVIADGTTKTYYVYSAQGQLLVEEDWAAGTSSNQVYFNGQLVATHGQDEYVRFVFKDHLGSTRSIATVTPPAPGNNWGYDWETTAVFDYNPFGDYASSSNQDPQSSRARFTGKEREDNGLDYFGARYYDSNRTQRWISPDPITSRIYDPPSLNKYAYVRNDPVNFIDPDGRLARAVFFMGYDDSRERSYWYWTYFDENDGSVDPVDGAPHSGGPNGWGPYHRERFTECRQKAIAAGVQERFLPNSTTVNWIMTAYALYNIDPAALAAIWSKESAFSTEMILGENKNSRGKTVSIDYGPLQINDYWKLNNSNWQKEYNPNGLDLKNDAFASFLAGAHDLADHAGGLSMPSLGSAVAYWHGPFSRDIGAYACDVYNRYSGISSMFECMKDK
jgi:RHS repeat-associated protein